MSPYREPDPPATTKHEYRGTWAPVLDDDPSWAFWAAFVFMMASIFAALAFAEWG